MQIGTCIYFSSMDGMAEKLAILRDNHFDSCQLISWSPNAWTDENAVTLKALFEKYGITISAFWCGWEGPCDWNFYTGQLTLGLVPPEYRTMRIKNLCDGADFALKLGVTDIVTHMGFIPENPYDPNFNSFCVAVRVVATHLKQNGQYLLFETGQETPVTMLRCFETVGCDNLGINLDTANLILYGKANPIDALYLLGKYIRDVHAKDGVYPESGHSFGKETPLGQGHVNFPKLIARLKECGYDGPITIEREIHGEQQIKDIRMGKAFLEQYI